MSKDVIFRKKFHCKKCNIDFNVESEVVYWNYLCPDCGEISLPKGYVLPSFKGLPTNKFHK